MTTVCLEHRKAQWPDDHFSFKTVPLRQFEESHMERLTMQEGNTLLAVPSLSEPKMLPAFFNPKGKLVRDISIVCYKAFADSIGVKDLTFADALSGTGARGVRVAREIDSFSKVFLNDTNSKALEFGRTSAILNGIESKCMFSQSEACAFLLSRDQNNGERFDSVDIDPFGTPSDFVDCGIRAVKDGRLLSVTATDSAVLCGVYPKVAQRKYLGLSLRTDYSQEVGMRLILGLLSLTAMRLETGIRPLFCHHDMHYFRAYAEIKVGNAYSRQNEKEIGFLLHCFVCGYRTVMARDEFFSHRLREPKKPILSEGLNCPQCAKEGMGKRSLLSIGGPCWIGKIQEQQFVKNCASRSEMQLFHTDELDIPLYYDLTALSERLRIRTPKITDVMERMRSTGHLASRTRLNPKALRTDAPIGILQSAVRELAQ